jgi:DNA-binding HxlR family transcriptional regulator
MVEIRMTILRETAERPKTFFELLAVTRLTYPVLTEVLESLISEGSVGKTSDGFQTLYVAPKART